MVHGKERLHISFMCIAFPESDAANVAYCYCHFTLIDDNKNRIFCMKLNRTGTVTCFLNI